MKVLLFFIVPFVRIVQRKVIVISLHRRVRGLKKVYVVRSSDPCTVCNNLFHLSKIDLEKAQARASDGCLGCKLIMCACKRFDQNEKNAGDPLSHTFGEEDSSKPRLSVVFGYLHFPYISVLEDYTKSQYYVFTTVQTRANGIGLDQRNIVSKTSGSPESLGYIPKWLHDCCTRHGCGPVNNAAQLPTRVLDLQCPEGVKLQTSKGLAGLYCALSHCWGGASSRSPARTTEATLKSRQTRIEESSLSKIFRDAIALSRHLAIRYLWIDSLCIIQDDAEDWARESAAMASMYQNAHLVIAATQAADGDKGCFSERAEPTFCFDVSLVNGQNAPVYLEPSRNHAPFRSVVSADGDPNLPLLSRAWCLQERLLATRLVHFVEDDLIWECQSQTLCECGYLDEHMAHTWSFKRRWAEEHERKQLFELWRKTAVLYMQLSISYGSDRLPALSRLAKVLQNKGAGDYVADLSIIHPSSSGGVGWMDGCFETP